MDPADAAKILTDAITNEMESITSFLTHEWAEALDSVALAELAPAEVRDALDLYPGAIWAEVVASIREVAIE